MVTTEEELAAMAKDALAEEQMAMADPSVAAARQALEAHAASRGQMVRTRPSTQAAELANRRGLSPMFSMLVGRAAEKESETRQEGVRSSQAVPEEEDPLAVRPPEAEPPMFIYEPSEKKKKGPGYGTYSVEGMPEEGRRAVQAGYSEVGARTGKEFKEAKDLKTQAMWDEHEAIGEQITQVLMQKQSAEHERWKLMADLPAVKKEFEKDKQAYKALLEKGVSYAAAWDRMGQSRRAIGGLAVALGGFVEGFTLGKVRNRAIEMINGAIERDVADQKMALVNALTSFGLSEKDYSGMMKRIDERTNDIRNAMTAVARMKISQAGLKAGHAKSIESAAKVLAGLQFKGLEGFAKAEKKISLKGKMRALPEGRLTERELQRVITGRDPLAPRAKRPTARKGIATGKAPQLVASKSEAGKAMAQQKQYAKWGYVGATYDDTGKITKPGKIRLGNLEIPIGRVGKEVKTMEKVNPKQVEQLQAASTQLTKAYDLAERQFSKKHQGITAGKWFNLADWLAGFDPYSPERLTKHIADGLGVMMAVAVQGARPAQEEQRIFARWQIKQGDTRATVRRKLKIMLEEMEAGFSQTVASYHPTKKDPKPLLAYHKQLRKFHRKIRTLLGRKRAGPYARTEQVFRARPKK